MIRFMKWFGWYRVLPLGIVLVLGICSYVFSFAPAGLFQSMYQLHYEDEIKQSADRHGVDPLLVAAVIDAESDWDADATSSRGAQGLMQLLPETAQDMIDLGLVDGSCFDADNLQDPATNIEFGCAYLAYLTAYFNGSTDHAIAAYNAGLSRVNDWVQSDTVLHNAITFPETQAYLVRVKTAWERYKELYSQAFVS